MKQLPQTKCGFNGCTGAGAWLDVPDIDSQIGLMHILFILEDVYGLTISEAGGEVCLKVSKDKGKEAYELLQMLDAWKEQANKLSASEIGKDDYDRWRYYYSEITTPRSARRKFPLRN